MDKNAVAVLMVFAIPIVAMIGGIAAGIVKMVSQHRLIELAYRERIAAIEHGVEVSRLPLFPGSGASSGSAANQRGRGFLTSGMVALGTGVGLCVTFALIPDARSAWPLGIIPSCIGIALLISARIVRGAAGEGTSPVSQ